MRSLRRALPVLIASALAPSCSPGSARQEGSGVPPAYTTLGTGAVTDFDYFVGGWETTQRRLRARGVRSNDWEEFPGTLCMRPYLGGMVTVDELVFPTKGWAGFTVRTFDLARRQWSIYWVSSATGALSPPVVGGFAGPRGVFYGEDTDEGRSVRFATSGPSSTTIAPAGSRPSRTTTAHGRSTGRPTSCGAMPPHCAKMAAPHHNAT